MLGLVFLSAVAISGHIAPARAPGFPGGPGLVCLMDPSTAPAPPTDPCPATPYTFTGPYPSTPQISPTQIRIGVYVNGSDSMNGVDITLESSDTSVLVPAYFDTTGTILPSPSLIVACVNGISVAGPCASTDTFGTIHIALFSTNGLSTGAPATGLLFTTIWNIVGNSPASGTGIGFQTGCSGTSVGPNVCVTISKGPTQNNAENIQGGVLANPSPVAIPWIALTSIPNATTISVAKGTAVSIVVTALAENGWPSLSNDIVTFSSQITAGLPAPSFSVLSCSTGGTRCTTTATLNTATAGSYVVYILGNYTTVDPTSLNTDTLVAPLRFNVNVQDVSLTVAPLGNVYMFGTFSLSVTLQSLGGFTGTVTLSTQTVSPATGVAFSYPASFSIAVNGVLTETVNVTSTAFNRYVYQMRMSAAGNSCGTGCTIVHASQNIAFIVSGFSLTPNATSIFTNRASHLLTVVVKSLGNTPATSFAGSVTFSSSSSPTGLTPIFNATSVALTAGGTKTLSVNFTSSSPGTYTASIIGTGGTNSLVTNQTVALTITLSSIRFLVRSTFQGVNSTISGTLGIYTATKMLLGTTMMNVVNATTGAMIFSKTATLNTTYTQFLMSHFVEEIPMSPLWLATSCAVDLNAVTVNCFLSRTPDIDHNGIINISDATYVGMRFLSTDPLANLSGTGTVNINDFTIEVTYYGVAVILP